MTTKKEIENELNKEIQNAEQELKSLEEEHKKFSDEHLEEEKRKLQRDKIIKSLAKLEESVYWGNWGSYDSLYHSKIPKSFNFDKGDEREMAKALTEVYLERKKILEESEEYKNIISEYHVFSISKFSAEHKEIDEKINNLKDTIDRCYMKKHDIQNKGFLLKECKRIAENKRRASVIQEQKNKIKKYKEMILSAEHPQKTDSEVKDAH